MPIDKDPKSVLFIITRGDSIGGGQIHVRDFCLELKQRSVKAWVVTGTSGALTDQLQASGIDFFIVPQLKRSINPWTDILAIRGVMKIIRKLGPELISTHTAKAGMVGRIAGFLTGTPTLFTAHGWQFAEGISKFQKLLVLGIETILARLTKRIITVSNYDRELAFKYHLGSSKKIRLVHNGLPFKPALKRKFEDFSKSLRLIMVARFQEQKDHKTLFLALARLKHFDWTLDLVGDGPLMEGYQSLAQELGLADRIVFHGQRLDVPDLLEKAQVFLLISHWEGFPRSIIEAMRAELPVVASDVGGSDESVEHGKTGFLVPRENVEALTITLENLMKDPQRCFQLGQQGRKTYEREFTFDAMFQKTQEIWKEVLNS